MNLFALALVAALVAAPAPVLEITYLSQPQGAKIYVNRDRQLAGVSPVTVDYKSPPASFKPGGECWALDQVTARWEDGVERTVEVNACPDRGWRQTFVIPYPAAHIPESVAAQAGRKQTAAPVPASVAPRAGREGKITIHVGPQTRDGFVDVDRGVRDSIEDIKAELVGNERLESVEERDHAWLVLEVLSRGATSTNGGGAVGMPIGTGMFFFPVGTIGLATVLRTGAYEKPLVFQNCGNYRRCAKLVIEDIETWLQANIAAVKRTVPAPAAPSTAVDRCAAFAAVVAATPGATLAQKIRALHPESFLDLSDTKLESLYRLDFPCLPK